MTESIVLNIHPPDQITISTTTDQSIVIEQQPPPVIEISMATVIKGIDGEKGDKGDRGDAGAYFEHKQLLPSQIWTVAHNLNKNPSVTITDNLGNIIISDVIYIDRNIVQIKHGVPLIGFVYCN